MKLMMVSALLSNALDPRSCFLQTLIGLACYAQGLRDKGFKVLNAFGVATSVFHIREHRNFWARMRNAIDEIIHIHKTMSHWTPSHSDSVVYATVDEAHSGTF